MMESKSVVTQVILLIGLLALLSLFIRDNRDMASSTIPSENISLTATPLVNDEESQIKIQATATISVVMVIITPDLPTSTPLPTLTPIANPNPLDIEAVEVAEMIDLESQFLNLQQQGKTTSLGVSPPIERIGFEGWSPDGVWMLLYTEHGEVTDYPYDDGSNKKRAYRLTRRHLWVADTQLIQAQEVATNAIVPQWSPDGRWIAYLNDTLIEGYYGHALWVTSPDGKEQYLLVKDVREYTWLDNDRLIFIRGMFYGEAFWQVSVNSQQVTPMEIVGFSEHILNAPSVSPYTHKIAFSNGSELWLGRFDNEQIMIEARVPRPDIAHTSWNPQGTLLTYGIYFHPYQILKADGTQAVELSQDASNRPAVWSSDGQSFVFASGDKIFVASADGQQIKQLIASTDIDVDQVFWRPDDKLIGFDAFHRSKIKTGILVLK